MIDNTLYYGMTDPATSQGEWNQLLFAMRQQMALLNTSMPVEVLSVQAFGVAPVGFVSIQVLVDQFTGDNKTIPHGEIPNVPYFRLQGGNNAIIIDPKVGDIGMASFSSRDISAVKNARMQAPPGSRRMYDMSDAMYFGGFLNQAPTQYIHFTDTGIMIYSPTQLDVEAPMINVIADLTTINSDTIINGDLSVTGESNLNGNANILGTFTNNGVNVGSTHKHGGVQTGGGNTGNPI